jgi:TonB family protein
MNTAVAPERWEGQTINGKFLLLRWLGGTGRTSVFSTEIPGLKAQKAAIKLIPADATNADQISRWQTAATLLHPNLLKIFDGGECEINARPMLYVVMELAEEDLSQVLPTRALSSQEADQMLAPVLDSLKYLHQKNLVHGRIKPANIMAVGDRLKLSTDSLRTAGEVMRSRGDVSSLVLTSYDPPETGTGPISPSADVWSLGMTLVTALTQKPPSWDRKTSAELSIPASIPEPFRQIARECLRRDPAERCTLAQIQQRLHGGPITAQVSRTPVSAPAKSSKLKVLAPIAVLVVAGGFFGVKWLSSRNQSATEVSAVKETPPPAASSPNTPSASSPSTGTVPGSVVNRVLPDVPRSARMTIHGKIKVVVRVNVNSAGAVSGATLLTPGPSHYFANLALQAAQQWKFQPAEVNGQAVPSEWMLEFLFGRNGPEVNPREARP